MNVPRKRSRRVQSVVSALVLILIVPAGALRSEAQPGFSPPKACGNNIAAAKLLDSFHSCALMRDVRKEIRARGLEWKVTGDTGPTETQLHMVKVANFSHLGSGGELRLLFYRDRLMQMQFAPPDPRDYWDRLVRVQRLHVVGGGDGTVMRARVGDRVEVWLNTEPQHRYVGWRDERLEREFSAQND